MTIVYRSNTGFTKEYAEMLAKAEKMKVCPLAEAQGKVGPGETVFYMGPLMAGHIAGIDQAVKQFTVKGVCGVGMSPAAVRMCPSGPGYSQRVSRLFIICVKFLHTLVIIALYSNTINGEPSI